MATNDKSMVTNDTSMVTNVKSIATNDKNMVTNDKSMAANVNSMATNVKRVFQHKTIHMIFLTLLKVLLIINHVPLTTYNQNLLKTFVY
jgi:hypothetical protein